MDIGKEGEPIGFHVALQKVEQNVSAQGAKSVATITNEMKANCIGEFQFMLDVPCGECLIEGKDEDCEVCGGELTHSRSIDVPWDTCKDIYKRMAMFAPISATSPASEMPTLEWAVKRCQALQSQGFDRVRLDVLEKTFTNAIEAHRPQPPQEGE